MKRVSQTHFITAICKSCRQFRAPSLWDATLTIRNQDSNMRFPLNIVSRAKRLFTSSPGKEKALNEGSPLAEFYYKSKGSKKETFFDSRACFDSDCDDDFFSVNGDFTPPQGSTSDNQISTPAAPKFNRAHFVNIFPDTKSEPFPTERKIKLSDLLQENPRSRVTNEQNVVAGKVANSEMSDAYKLNNDQPLKSPGGSPIVSGADSVYGREVSSERSSKQKKEKTRKISHCCLPSLPHSCGLTDRRKHKMGLECLSS